MGLSTEEAQEFRESAGLMSADELRAMADDPDLKDIIADVLANGKAVEMKQPADIEDEHPNPDDVRKEPKRINVDDDEDDEDDEDEDDDAAAASAQAAADAAASAAAAADQNGAAPAEVGDVAPLDLKFLDAEYQQRLVDLNAQKSAKFNEMMEGVITPEAYAAYESEYFDKRDGLKDEKQDDVRFFTVVHNFKVQALADGINYDTDKAKGDAWDEWVKRIASNPANAHMTDTQVLELAHKKVMVEFDVKPGKGANSAANGTKTVADGKKVAEKQGRAPKLDNIPPTLGGIPAAASSDGQDDGEFAHLDGLSGMDYERAVARLTPEQRDRYGMM